MLGVKTPNEADPVGDWYAFEKGAEKTHGGGGFADVWKRGYFAWEYKGKRKDLVAAYDHLLQYREALDNPPLLIVCDLDRFEVHANFTKTPATVHTFTLSDLIDAPQEPLRILHAVMESPEDLRPGKTRDELTAEAAEQFASLAFRLRERDHEPQTVAHFLNKLLSRCSRRTPVCFPAALSGDSPRQGHVIQKCSQPGLANSSERCPTRAGYLAPNRSSGSTADYSTGVTPSRCSLTRSA
jgi:hypothetical protein